MDWWVKEGIFKYSNFDEILGLEKKDFELGSLYEVLKSPPNYTSLGAKHINH